MSENIDISMIKTCSACPEQYDMLINDKQAGYFRLRHGTFTVTCPDHFGTVVYVAYPNGDGEFYDDEREHFLSEGQTAAIEWYVSQGK